MAQLIQVTPRGLYCPQGNFYVDPWGETETAIITHAHSDHARFGSQHYFASVNSLPILQHRLPQAPHLHPLEYGERRQFGDVIVSLHPAGHILGSAQVRIEAEGEVWVVTGDYKRCDDPSCEPFEIVPSDVLITEATFGAPVYQWQAGDQTVAEIFQWWSDNRDQGITSLLFCYALGKAQRILAELTRFTDEPVYTHGAVETLTNIYRKAGIEMLPTIPTTDLAKNHSYAGALVLAPPSAHRSVWMKRFKNISTGFASGWMRVRGHRRRRGYQRGFVLSDHADWPSLLRTVRECGAQKIYVTHGYKDLLARYLSHEGMEAHSLDTLFTGDEMEAEVRM
ncbi:ligase-associated DNA damage response exonuclease [Saccharophagus sp. K07]|uniref:ligase-associated DNA damage response exonuclease n=1 Tax=Saccharophagus sp. K07 TaxID=2283636 RepID=UPI001651B6A0|nr:ligase-associated DNA damage response exonuclease [Saccharophagus sp. K07]MBC6905626.1 ligase-associated DNA damage response exonuclease [Saccharophagus sp. K07]